MKDDLKRLKLLGKNYSDLRTISAYCQDSIVKIGDIKYLKKNKIILIMLNRFMWEDIEKGFFREYRRVKSVLKFDNIFKVSVKNINQNKKNRNLELLAIKANPYKNNMNEINLIFSGSSILSLKAEEIEIMLDDQEESWIVKKLPKHKI
tara:strand:- start:125 stop:571 length:447 start_codon:yes stop_codon:yes gene_type:complete